jgi:PKD repeat protein
MKKTLIFLLLALVSLSSQAVTYIYYINGAFNITANIANVSRDKFITVLKDNEIISDKNDALIKISEIGTRIRFIDNLLYSGLPTALNYQINVSDGALLASKTKLPSINLDAYYIELAQRYKILDLMPDHCPSIPFSGLLPASISQLCKTIKYSARLTNDTFVEFKNIIKNGDKIILVAHSQGNLFAEAISALLYSDPEVASLIKNQFRSIGLGSISATAFSNKYVNISSDDVVYDTVGKFPYENWKLLESSFDACYLTCVTNNGNSSATLKKYAGSAHGATEIYLNKDIYVWSRAPGAQRNQSIPITTVFSNMVKESWLEMTPAVPSVRFEYLPIHPKIGEIITFTPTATSANGSILKYKWSFGDGGGTEVTNSYPVQYVYRKAGTYPVQLIVTDNRNSINVATQNLIFTELASPIITSFPNTTAQVGIQKTFTIIGTDLPNEGLVVNVEGCTNFAYTANSTVAHTFTCTFNQAKTYPVTITTKTSPTALGTFNITVGYAALPVVAFTISPQNPKVNERVTYTVTQASSQNGNIVSYEWYAGIGSPATFTDGDPKAFIYTTPGTYTVKLTVIDAKGASSSVTNQVIVSPIAVAQPSINAFGYPIGAKTNTPLLFDISGQNLPTSPLTISAPGCTNFSYLAQTATKHTFYCTYTNAGAYQMTISTAEGVKLGTYNVTTSSNNLSAWTAASDVSGTQISTTNFSNEFIKTINSYYSCNQDVDPALLPLPNLIGSMCAIRKTFTTPINGNNFKIQIKARNSRPNANLNSTCGNDLIISVNNSASNVFYTNGFIKYTNSISYWGGGSCNGTGEITNYTNNNGLNNDVIFSITSTNTKIFHTYTINSVNGTISVLVDGVALNGTSNKVYSGTFGNMDTITIKGFVNIEIDPNSLVVSQ